MTTALLMVCVCIRALRYVSWCSNRGHKERGLGQLTPSRTLFRTLGRGGRALLTNIRQANQQILKGKKSMPTKGETMPCNVSARSP